MKWRKLTIEEIISVLGYLDSIWGFNLLYKTFSTDNQMPNEIGSYAPIHF